MLTLDDLLSGKDFSEQEQQKPKGNLGVLTLDDLLSVGAATTPKEERSSLGQAWSALKEGTQDTLGAVGSTARTYAGDSEGVVQNAKEAKERSSQSEAVRRTEFKQDLSARRKARGEDDSWTGAASDVIGAIGSNKEGAAQEMIAQLPNAAPSIGGGLAGAKLGLVVAPALGVFAPLAPIVGGALGMIFGATAVETGFKANEKAADGDFTDQERSDTIREGAVKGTVVGAMDAATLGASRAILGTAARASSNAAAKVLTDAGVDATSKAAVSAALRNPAVDAAVKKAAIEAAQAAAKTANTLPKRAMRGTAVLGSEAFGEGGGEYLGELAATGEADKADAILEGAMGLGQSALEIPASKLIHPSQKLTEAPIAAATSEEEDKQKAGPTQSQLFTESAFAQVAGDEGVLQQQAVQRAQLAVALSQLDDAELDAATTHIAKGNEELKAQLSQIARDTESIKQAQQAFGQDVLQYIQVADTIRRDAGITPNDATETPTAPQIAQAVSAELDATGQLPLNTAGFVPEPTVQLQAQLAAVMDGTKPAVIMGVDDAQRVNLEGFSVGTAMDPNTGQEVMVVARDDGTVNNFVTRADEVGVQQAAGEILGYADPSQTTNPTPDAVAVQQLNEAGVVVDEQLVNQDSVGGVQQMPGTQTRVVPVQQALMERTQRVSEEQAAQTEQAPLRTLSPPAATSSPRTDAWVAGFNQQLGIDPASETAVDPASIQEVKPNKATPELKKLVKAVKDALGVDVLLVQTPSGSLMRRNGTPFNSFNGVASGNTLIMNVDAATPLNTFGHELSHILQTQYPDIYAKMEVAVLSRLSFQKAKAFKDGLQAALAQEGNPAELEAEFRSEIVAEAVGEMSQDPAFWSDVFAGFNQDAKKAKTLYDTVIAMLQKLAKAFTKNGYISGVKDMQKVRRAATDAFIAWSAANDPFAMFANNATPAAVPVAAPATPPADKLQRAENTAGLSKFNRENIAAAARGDTKAPSMEVMAIAPDYMARLGVGRNLPVVIEAQTIYKVATGKGFDRDAKRTPLTVDQIERLPQLLSKPAAVFNDPTGVNSVVVMTTEVIDGFDPLVVAISKSPQKKQLLIERLSGSIETSGDAFAPINTAFGKNWQAIDDWLSRDGALRMIDAKQIDAAVKAGMPKQVARKLREAQLISKGRVYAVGGTASLDQIAYAPQQGGVTSDSNPVSPRQAPPADSITIPPRTGKTLSLKKPADKWQRTAPDALGAFTSRSLKDGSLEVYGNPQDIRGQLPEGVAGRLMAGGIKFTTSDAPRVKAALSGETLAYSRQGKVYDKLAMNNKGEYIGAPAKFNKPGNISKLRKILKDLTLEGAPGRFWYERSSEEVLRMTGGNVQEARKFVALLSIYSPQAKVDANSTFAVRAWAQHKAGQPIKVKTEVQDNKAAEALQDVDKFWSGEKTGNFYNNLLRMIDPTTGDKQGATIDMWMMRAGQYSNDAPTATQYAFMENETNKIAKELGWEPQQIQAAIWVAMKARMENDGVKKRTEAISEKKGWIKYVPGKDGKGKKRVIIDEQKHRDNWLRESFELKVSAQDTAQAKFDFADGILRHIGQVSWEPRPSTKLPILPGIHKAPYAQQLEFYQAVQQALYDENGADMLAQKLGLLVDGETQAPGIWESEVSAGGQKRIAMAPAAGKDGVKGIDPAQKKLLDAYSATLGLLLRQDGVGYHRPFYKSNKGDQNGVELRIGRPFTPEEAKQLWTSINTLMYDQGFPQWEQHVGLVSSPEGMRIIKFWGLMDNNAFRAAVDKSVDSLPFDINESTDFAADGNLVDNNWQENPNGQNYQEVISGAGRPDLLGWSRDVLAPRVQAVFQEYATKYNWGDPGQIRFSRTLAGPAELAGRPSTRSDAGIGRSVQGAIHYGRSGYLSNLVGASFGSGIKGAEQQRLKEAADPRIKKRVYFYLPVPGGIAEPEIGLGAHVYSSDLSGLYDPDGTIRDADPNAFESKVLDAGYRGYLNREQGTAVVLNEDVPVKYLGTADQFNKVQRKIERMIPKVATREEGAEFVRKADPFVSMDARAKVQEVAPSFKMQYGEYRVKKEEKDAANAALESAGSQFRFSRKSEPTPIKIKMAGATLSVQDGQKFIDELKQRVRSIEEFVACVRS
jgi:hypothetical protein